MENKASNQEPTKKLKKIFTDASPEFKHFAEEVKSAASETLGNAKDQMAKNAKAMGASVHSNVWSYLAGTAAASAILGFFVGRSFKSQCKQEDSRDALN